MKHKKFSAAALLLIAVINLYFLIAVRICDHHGTNWQTIIYSDGKGYYEYLRAAFINHNLAKEDSSLGYIRISQHGPVIKFFCGTAIAQAPFFTVAYVISLFHSQITDGYTKEFQILIALAGYCYLLLGLYFLKKLLQQFYFSDIIIALTLLLITYGTNLFYYAVLEPSMSHVYAFACVAGFVFSARQYFKTDQVKHLILASIFFGLNILIRPTNVVVVFMIPFLVWRKEDFFRYLKNIRHILLAVIIISVFVFLQMLSWKLQTGNWIVWSYTGEGFYFMRPAIFNVLLSYDKGWFVYTPLTALAIFGFFPLWKMNRSAAISIALTLIAAVYFTAAWWCWDYANSFGMRPLIDFYSLVGVLLAVLISSLQKIFFRIFGGVLLLSVLVLSGVQTYQYYQGILQHYSMNKGKYWHVFMRTGDAYKNILGGNADLMPYTKKSPQLILEAKNDFSTEVPHWLTFLIVPDEDKVNRCGQFDSASTRLLYSIVVDSSFTNADELYAEISLRRLEYTEHSSSSAKIVAGLKNDSESIFSYNFAMNDFPDLNTNEWRTYHYAFWIRKQYKPYNTFTFEIQNPAKQNFLVDDVEIKVYKMFQR